MLPEGWKPYRLGELMSFRNGLNFKQADIGEEIKIVGVSDFQARSTLADTSELATISVSGTVRETDLLQDGDLLFVRSNGNKALIGRCLYFPIVQERLSFSGFTIRGRIDSTKVLPEFSSYLVRADHVTAQFFQGGSGTNISNLSQEILSDVCVTIPKPPEQERISELLLTWDKAISTIEKLLANSRRQKQVLMQQLLTGKRRLQKFVISKARLTTRFGSIPEDWRHVPIEQVAQDFSAKNAADRQLPVLSCTKYGGLVDSLSYFNKQVFSQDVSTYKLVERGCFAYATNHIDEGSIGYQNLYDEALISPMYTVFKPGNDIDHGYLFKLLKTEHYRQIFAANTNASVDRRGSLRWGDFKKIEIPLPSLAEQVAISGIIDSAQLEIESIQKQFDRLKDEKRALMQQLLTGKRRVHLPATETANA